MYPIKLATRIWGAFGTLLLWSGAANAEDVVEVTGHVYCWAPNKRSEVPLGLVKVHPQDRPNPFALTATDNGRYQLRFPGTGVAEQPLVLVFEQPHRNLGMETGTFDKEKLINATGVRRYLFPDHVVRLPECVPVTAEQLEGMAIQSLELMDEADQSTRRQLGSVQATKDPVKTLCLKDKLHQIEVATRSGRDRLASFRTAVGRDVARASHEYTAVILLRDRVRRVLGEANQCIGEASGFADEPKVRVEIDPAIPTTDPTAIPPSTNQDSLRPWLKGPYDDGMGLRTGDLEVHLGVATDVGFDSNYAQRSDDGLQEQKVSAWRFRPSAHLTIRTLDRPRELGARSAPLHTLAWANVWGNLLSESDTARPSDLDPRNDVGGMAGLAVDIRPMALFNADLHVKYSRLIEPSNTPERRFGLERNVFTVGVGGIARPGGGLFDSRLGYDLHVERFGRDAFHNLNNIQHAISLRERWKFLPRTAAVYDGSLGMTNYVSDQAVLGNSASLRSSIGVSGLISNHVSLLALYGWGATYLDTNSSFTPGTHGPIARTELRWLFQSLPPLQPAVADSWGSGCTIGYTRDFRHNYLTEYDWRDRWYGRIIWGSDHFNVVLEAGASHLDFPQSYWAKATSMDSLRYHAFSENRWDAQLSATYGISDQVAIDATLGYEANFSSASLPLQRGAPDVVHPLGFRRSQSYLGVHWRL